MIYLDNAATTLKKPPGVARAMVKALESAGNPSRGAHEPSLAASRLVYDTRIKLAELLKTDDPARIAFTYNSTDSLNMAIKGTLKKGDHVITTETEHNSVLRPLYETEKAGVELTIIKADKKGLWDVGELEKAIKPNTRAAVINHSSNVTGNTVDLAKISEITKKHGILLIVDGSQSVGSFPVDVNAADIFCFTGHKGLMGPQGVGGIYVREGVDLSPLRTGGSGIHSRDKVHPQEMPDALEAGTLNVHGIAGLNAALDFILNTEDIYEKKANLADEFCRRICDIKGLTVYGDIYGKSRSAVISVNIEGLPSDILCDRLWTEYNICTRAGLHCAPLMHKALGTLEWGVVRFSFSYFNTSEEVKAAAKALGDLAREAAK